jgi:hypothetical protein
VILDWFSRQAVKLHSQEWCTNTWVAQSGWV